MGASGPVVAPGDRAVGPNTYREPAARGWKSNGMTDDLGSIALTIISNIGALAGLLVVMTLLEPSKTAAWGDQTRHRTHSRTAAPVEVSPAGGRDRHRPGPARP